MPSLDVIQPPTCVALEKELLLRSSNQVYNFESKLKVFDAQSAFPEDVIISGLQALVCLYNGKPAEGLDFLRYARFCEKVATKTSHIQPQTLPPTSAAAKYHSLRVYFQIQQWKGSGVEFTPVE